MYNYAHQRQMSPSFRQSKTGEARQNLANSGSISTELLPAFRLLLKEFHPPSAPMAPGRPLKASQGTLAAGWSVVSKKATDCVCWPLGPPQAS